MDGRSTSLSEEQLDSLREQARRWAFDQEGIDPVPEISERIEISTGLDRAHLHLARATALQNTDPTTASADNLDAARLFTAAGRPSAAASAAAAAATCAEVAGSWGTAVELALAATDQLAQVRDDDLDTARAALALCALYGHMGAFELALPFGARAVASAQALGGGLPLRAAAFTHGYLCIEAIHNLPADEATRAGWTATARQMIEHLSAGDDKVSTHVLAAGLSAELALLADDADAAHTALGPGLALVDHAAPTFAAWFTFVHGTALARTGDRSAAEAALTDAIPGLEVAADDHCLVRALTERAALREETGNLRGALADIRRLAALTRGWQIARTQHLAHLISEQGELEHIERLSRRRAAALTRTASIDSLTGAYSRRWLDGRLREIADLGEVSAALLLIDIDEFRLVNDAHDHTIGDQLLRAVAEQLRRSFREGEVARFGGEEFAVTMVGDRHVAVGAAERARIEMQQADFDHIAPGVTVRVSIGVATGPARSSRLLVETAHDALYVAKQTGRNRVVDTHLDPGS